MLSHLLFTVTERYWWEIQFKCYVGKSWNDRIEKEEMAKITIMQSFDTSRYHYQVFKEIWTDWNLNVYLNRWRNVMYIFLIMKNTYLPQFSNKLDENLKFVFIWPNMHFFLLQNILLHCNNIQFESVYSVHCLNWFCWFWY